jgi:hypothetical protein
MSGQEQLFSANLAKTAVCKTGLRSFMEYRDLGIEQAVHETVVVGRMAEAAAAR